MLQNKNVPRFLDKQLRSKNFVTLVVLLALAALFYVLAIVRLKTG